MLGLLISLKVRPSPSVLIESLLEMMENAFYFILKAFSFSRYLRFCHEFLVMYEK